MSYVVEESSKIIVHQETIVVHDFQQVFNVLKDLHLDHHITEEERKFLHIE